MAIEDLLHEIKKNPDLEASIETIIPFIDGPGFFERFLEHKRNFQIVDILSTYRDKFIKAEGNLLQLIGMTGGIFKEYLNSRYTNLDEISKDRMLAIALGLSSRSCDSIARACIALDLLDSTIPANHAMPDSFYVHPDIVGYKKASENVLKYIPTMFETIDGLRQKDQVGHLGPLLGIDSNEVVDIVKACIKRGILSADMPLPKPCIVNGKRSHFLNPKFVGEKKALENLTKYLRYHYPDLDSIRHHTIEHPIVSILKYSLQTTGKRLVDTIRVMVQNQIYSPIMPENHPLVDNDTRRISWYVNELAVGKKFAEENLKRYVQNNYATISNIKSDIYLGRALGLSSPKSISQLKSKIIELGWLSAGCSSGAESDLPSQFQKKRGGKPKKNFKDIGTKTRQKIQSTTFLKGEVFEQIVGLYFAYTHADQIIIPQFCLEVSETSFKTRADFKVGNHIVEVKWGNARKNIKETYCKHAKLMEGTSLDYQLIRLEQNEEEPDIPSIIFGPLIDQLDEKPQAQFQALIKLLSESVDDNMENRGFLLLLRDYLYDKVNMANQKIGVYRQEYISDTLFGLLSSEEIENYMQKNTDRCFSSFEAHFEHDGVLYRAFINPKGLEEEAADKYQTIYTFGNIWFESEKARNTAVLIECSPLGIHIESIIQSPGEIQRDVIFRVKDDIVISTEEINSLHDVKEILNLNDEMYEFALRYIASEN